MKTGVLLINLGTPDAPTLRAVRRYLREFLNDPAVIDLPWALRTLLVNGIIIPFRTKKSTHAYQSIWRTEGSPLTIYSRQLADALQAELGENYTVALGMRYGHPSLEEAIRTLQQSSRVIVVPLFPQYSHAASGSAIQAALKALCPLFIEKNLTVIHEHYADAGFIAALATQVQKSLSSTPVDALMVSYHGLPTRQLSPCQSRCVASTPCPEINTQNKQCYRAQCYATSRFLANALDFPAENIITCFQSRLGKIEWIRPYTDEQLPLLYAQGVRRLAVVCPSFVTDCLETLEEIGIRLRAQWLALGGESLTLVPCLNDNAQWVTALAAIITRH